MNIMKKFFSYLTVFLVIGSCSLDDAEYVKVVELTTDAEEYLIPAEGGSVTFRLYSNGDFTSEVEGGLPEWAKLEKSAESGDADFTVTFEENTSLRRSVLLDIAHTSGEASRQVRIKQEGTPVYLSCISPFRAVKGSTAAKASFEIDTNIPASGISRSIEYLDSGQDWISSVSDGNGVLDVTVAPSTGDKVNKARIVLSYTDGWGEEHSLSLFVTRADSSDRFGQEVTFQALRALASGDGDTPVEESLILEGIIVSDCGNPNMELNPTLKFNSVDTDASLRTAYLESADGSLGVKLVFSEASGNVLVHGTLVSIDLQGTILTKTSDPETYTLSSLTGENILSAEAGASVPEKRLSLSALTDSDIYTFCTVENLEFAIKEGTWSDVRENYVLKSEVNETADPGGKMQYFFLDGWATLLTSTDSDGAVYAAVNMLCPWRKNFGEPLPAGQGSLSGIIVHNDIRRYGSTGRYQIRPLSGDCFTPEGDSPWTTLAKWDGSPYKYDFKKYAAISARYADRKLASVIPSDDITAAKKTPAAELFIEKDSDVSKVTGPVRGAHSYKSLKVVDIASGCGISATYKTLQIHSDIKGWYRWSEDGSSVTGYNGIRLEFSTEGLSGTQMMLTIGMCGGNMGLATTLAFPSHWCVEWSVDGENYTVVPDSATGKEYFSVRSLPYLQSTLNGSYLETSASAGLGSAVHSFRLPSDLFGKEKAYLRIRPSDTVVSGLPTLYTDETESSHVSPKMVAEDFINIENLFIKYR